MQSLEAQVGAFVNALNTTAQEALDKQPQGSVIAEQLVHADPTEKHGMPLTEAGQVEKSLHALFLQAPIPPVELVVLEKNQIQVILVSRDAWQFD